MGGGGTNAMVMLLPSIVPGIRQLELWAGDGEDGESRIPANLSGGMEGCRVVAAHPAWRATRWHGSWMGGLLSSVQQLASCNYVDVKASE